MTGIGYWHGVMLCGLVACSLGAMAQGQSGEQPSGNSGPKWGSHIDVEAKPGSKRNLGEADLFMPLSQDGDSLIFANLRGRFDNYSSNEGNFGLGMRRMQPNGWNFGVYGYLDHRRTDQGSLFNQGTLGAEALGRDWDFRANGYLPLGNRIHNLGTTGGGASTAAISGASVQITTPGSTTSEERALGGYDAEVGWRLPLFGAEDRSQLRLYLGGYRFADDVLSVSGQRLRAEFTLAEVPGLWQGAQLFLGAEAQDDNARGGQTFLSLRLRIPFGGKAERSQQLTAQERRMAAPIVRDVDIVSQTRVAASTPQLVENATTTVGGQAITLFDSATTTGAALPGAVWAAPANTAIILSGTFNTTATTRLSWDGKSLLAGSIAVRSASGRIATLVTSATIAGTNTAGYVVRLGGNNTLSGLTITGTQNNGTGFQAVHLDDNAGNITVSNNTITATQTGNNYVYGLMGGGITNLVVSGNTITATGTNLGAQNIRALVLASGTATVSGNTLSASGGGAANHAVWVNGVLAPGSLTFNAGSTGNTISAGACTNTGGVINNSISFTNGTTCP